MPREEYISDQPTISSEQAVSILQASPFSTEIELKVKPTFTIDQILALVQKRGNETFFTESQGQLWVTSRANSAEDVAQEVGEGAARGRRKYEQLETRLRSGILVAHTHAMLPDPRINPFNRQATYWLSWSDIWNISYENNPNAKYVLFHQLGALQYTYPRISGSVSTEDVQSVAEGSLIDFSHEQGINFCPYESMIPELKTRVSDLPIKVRIEKAVEFSQKYGVIQLWAPWKEPDKVQKIVDIINLKAS